MSGICGYWSLRTGADTRAVVSRIVSAQHRLGPDAATFYHSPEISLAHQLLRITAEDVLETQPWSGPRKSLESNCPPYVMVADARVYNRSELSCEFSLSFDEAAQMPDSAYVALAWERWGRRCVDHLVGSFALAVWEPQARQLFLARDHAGERPLYYCHTADGFAFATSARALLKGTGVGGEIDEQTLARHLFALPPEHTRTYYRHIRQIGPGHSMLVGQDDNPSPRRYWMYDQLAETRFPRDQDYVEAFREVFDEAVRCRLRTAGNIGSELSAGLDSGSVTATAAGLLNAAGRKLTAFTSVPRPGFSGLSAPHTIPDEGPYAAEVAALYPNVDHLLLDSTGSDMMSELERSYDLLERPLGAPVNQTWINLIQERAAADGINVLLSGSQGNATVSYSGSDVIGQSFRRGHWLRAARQAYRMRREGITSGREALSQTICSLLPWSIRTRFDPYIQSFDIDSTALLPERDCDLRLFDELKRNTVVSGTRLPPMMQTGFLGREMGDHHSMSLAGRGIELRDPTADKRVFEFCASIPMEQYVVGTGGRSLIRRAMRGRMPDAALDRRMRGVQGADWYEALTAIRAQIAAEITRLYASPGARHLLDLDRVRRAVEDWPATAQQAAQQSYLYSMLVPDAIATGYFIRRTEEDALVQNPDAVPDANLPATDL